MPKLRVFLGLFICLLLQPVSLAGQSRGPQDTVQESQTQQEPASEQELPSYKLEFSAGKPVAGVQGAHFFVNPRPCAPDGAIFVQWFDPQDWRNVKLVSLGAKGGHFFSVMAIPNLYDVTLFGVSPTDSEVALLIDATKDPKISQYTMMTPHGAVTGNGRRGEHHEFIALFDRNGNYKSLVELPRDYEYKKVAEFDSGDFLLLAYEPVNRVASLQVVSSSGEFLRPIEMPPGMVEAPALNRGETGGQINAARASGSLSLWEFAAARKRVVLYRPHSDAPVLEVSSGGAVRAVPLATPAGYELDGFVPANDRWIVRYRRKGIPDPGQGAVDANVASGNYLLYEVNPLDGSLKASLKLERGSVFDAACEADGELTKMKVDDMSRFVLSTASLPR